MADVVTSRPKRPPRPRSRFKTLKPRASSANKLTRPRAGQPAPTSEPPPTDSPAERIAFDGTTHASIRARRIYEGGIEYAEGLSEFINGYHVTTVERSTKSFLTRLYNGAAEYLGWCLDTGRLPRVHTLPPGDALR